MESDGYAVTSVVGEHACGSWSYTVGLSSHLGGPELLVWGLNRDLACRLLTAAITGLGGSIPPVRERAVRHDLGVDDLIPGRRFCLVDVDPQLVSDTFLVSVAHHFELVAAPVQGVVQLVVSDRFGLMPWHHEYDGPAQCLLDDLPEARRWLAAC
ncbi:MAG TPA: DUF4262 domain-containing protein [Acidimicrobiales bacterium]